MERSIIRALACATADALPVVPSPLLERLVTVLRRPAWLAARLRWNPAHFRRETLQRGTGWEVALLTWLPGQQTGVHGHGPSVGLGIVLTGTLCETRYGAANGALLPVSRVRLTPGQWLVEPMNAIHRVANEGDAPAASLHAYSPAYDYEASFAALLESFLDSPGSH